MPGKLQLEPPAELPALTEHQPVKAVVGPEDVVLSFPAQILGTPFYLGRGVIEEVSCAGPTERLGVRLLLWSRNCGPAPDDTGSEFILVDENYS